MKKEEIERKALERFQSGFHCAESVSGTIIEAFGENGNEWTPEVATGFGGGIGGTKAEACGALTGGIIAIGRLYGRKKPGADKQLVYELASEYRKRFIEAFGSATCQTIVNGLGPQENMAECKKLTARAAGILAEILAETDTGTA